jgi:hypothetical protein
MKSKGSAEQLDRLAFPGTELRMPCLVGRGGSGESFTQITHCPLPFPSFPLPRELGTEEEQSLHLIREEMEPDS